MDSFLLEVKSSSLTMWEFHRSAPGSAAPSGPIAPRELVCWPPRVFRDGRKQGESSEDKPGSVHRQLEKKM